MFAFLEELETGRLTTSMSTRWFPAKIETLYVSLGWSPFQVGWLSFGAAGLGGLTELVSSISLCGTSKVAVSMETMSE